MLTGLGRSIVAGRLRHEDRKSGDAGQRDGLAHGVFGCDVSSPSVQARIGTLTSPAYSTLIGTPAGGAILTKYGYLSLSMFTGATMLAGSILVVVSRLILDRRLGASV